MARRLHEADKWDDKWFRALLPNEKLVFLFLIDKCDLAGFYEIDIDDMKFRIGLSEEQIKTTFKGLNRGCLGAKDSGWIWVKNFIRQQKNLPLNPLNNAHKHIIQKLKDQLLRFSEVPDYITFMNENLGADLGLISPIGIDKGNGKDIDKDNARIKEEDVIRFWESAGYDKKAGSKYFNHYAGFNWIVNGKEIGDWKRHAKSLMLNKSRLSWLMGIDEKSQQNKTMTSSLRIEV